MTKLFRTLVAVSFLLYGVWMASFYFAYALFAPEIANAIVHSGAESTLRVPDALFWAMPGLWLIAAIGMWRFSQGARTFYLVLTVAGLVTTAVSGILIQSPAQVVVSDLISLCDGAVLTMAYFTGLDARFRSDASNQPLQPTAGSGS